MLKKYDPSNPQMVHSAVCFTDILGFSQMVLDAHQNGTGDQLLQRLHKILTEQYEDLKPEEDYMGVFKAFTDNIVIGLPIYDDGESQLGGIFLDFASFQLALTLEGFFIRGGLAVGDYYGDNEFAYGPSIIEAHYLENNQAIHPRIILSDESVQMVREHIDYYAEPSWAPQYRDLLQDNTDGKWFINYLEALMTDAHEQGNYQDVVTQLLVHKDVIEQNLTKFQGNARVYPKYEWAAQYHNYFCTHNIPQRLLQRHNNLLITQQTMGNFARII
ncbi:hypothetical protein [Brevibacillus brevis]|uniref:hypothetical protein n=1 Tax=Brevibacillus brevis TaxID=1393 RepID=UPI0037C96BED